MPHKVAALYGCEDKHSINSHLGQKPEFTHFSLTVGRCGVKQRGTIFQVAFKNELALYKNKCNVSSCNGNCVVLSFSPKLTFADRAK